MKALGSLMSKKILRRPTQNWDEKSLFFCFQRIIKEEYGQQGAVNLIPDFWQDKTLFIIAKKSIWGGELWLNRATILKKLNQELGGPVIRELKIKQ